MELQVEVKKQYRSLETWLEQISNILSTIFWFLGTWLIQTVVLVGVVWIYIALTYKGESYAITEFQHLLKNTLFLCGLFTTIVTGIFGLPRHLRNVFKEKAFDRLQRYSSVKKQFENQVQTTDDLLLKYGLITQKDIENRKKGLSV